MKRPAGRNQAADSTKQYWKRRPSEIRGYRQTLYLTDDNNDYIRVDYNLKEKRIRLYIEVFKEGGSPYYSVIRNGRITAEKSILSGRSFGFTDKFVDRAEIFSSIPNREIIALINGNYGIGAEALKKRKKRADEEKKERLSITRKRYFSEAESPYRAKRTSGRSSARLADLSDLLDLAVGAAVSGGIFYYLQYNFLAMGVVASFYGISLGLVDFIIRERSPRLPKILLFLIFGTASYIYGYFLI